MNTSIYQNAGIRPLFLDFNLYTDGDADFKKELIDLMIDNLRELKESLKMAYSQNSVEIFQKTSHKVKPTISMLNDNSFMDVIEEVKKHFADENRRREIATLFNGLCDAIIQSLESENK